MTTPAVRTTVPHVGWETFTGNYFTWQQGEHIGLIGPTGQGKTTLSLQLLPWRRFVVVLATKPRDKVLQELRRNKGYVKMESWKNYSPTMYPRRMVWPNARDLHSDQRQKEAFSEALEAIYHEGSWTVYFDEMWYIGKHLKMEHAVKTYLLQARSLDISVVAASQRPAWIPLELYDQATHLFFFRENDERNLRRISGIGFLNSDIIQYHVARLDDHEILYVNTRSGVMARTRAPKLDKGA